MSLLSLALRTLVVLVIVGSARTQAQTSEPELLPSDPSQRFVRSGSIYVGLAAASTALAATLIPTRPEDSWGQGVGFAHAVFAVGYAFDGVMRLTDARRIRRAVGRSSPRTLMASSGSWVLWFNFGTAAAMAVGGMVGAALPVSDEGRGVAVTFAAHGSWLLSFAISQLVKSRRGKITWMAYDAGSIRF